MKRFLSILFVTCSLMAATSSFALVKLVASCSTADGQYSLVILDNQGIGFERHSRLSATIKDVGGEMVGDYALIKKKQGIRPISFSSVELVDSATNGRDFSFAYPSTNTPFSVQAVLKDGTQINYGQRGESALNCRRYD